MSYHFHRFFARTRIARAARTGIHENPGSGAGVVAGPDSFPENAGTLPVVSVATNVVFSRYWLNGGILTSFCADLSCRGLVGRHGKLIP